MSQKESYITLLKEQLTKVDDRAFNLSSWKKATCLVLESYFGMNAPQVKAIEKIDYAYGSWALRDESGVSDPVKTDCKSTLSMIIREMEITADKSTQEDNQTESGSDLSFVWTPLEDELTGASLKKLKSLLTTTNVETSEVEKFLKDLPGQTTINVLQSVLISESFRNWIAKQ